MDTRYNGVHVYDHQTLLDYVNRAPDNVHDDLQEKLLDLGLLRRPGHKPLVSPDAGGQEKSRRKRYTRKWKRGNRAGVCARLKTIPSQLALPSILLSNVCSLDNKLDYIRLQRTARHEFVGKMEGHSFLIYSNVTRFMTVLTMESLDIPPSSAFTIFIFGIITYCLILLFHSILLVTIAVKRDLHKPMYILLFNLSLNDVLATTSFYPQLVCSILSQTREISYPACTLQGFLIHFCWSVSLLFLTVMAYDRYVAICQPLRYHNLMTQGTLVKLIFMVWSFSFSIIVILLTLTVSKEICRTYIVDIYCNNPSLMKLSCEDTRVINYYGLFTIALVQGPSILIVSITYIKILFTCLSTKQAKSISKAMQTCGTHLVVFLSFEVNTFLLLISHRLEAVSPHLRRAFGVSAVVISPLFNPLIFGLNTREIRKPIFQFLQRFLLVNRT
ncbi:olfactory receptor 6E1-like [Hemibagrus wyckioides]|uniref:olfactory receptor 6E1-like n=1 Tax=Hemibagrus wyckioides TaxID=337641 RepID=UPI00266C29A1|nr:olfactory receptor 6E1-like [Hemibagrus wyckioides]